MLSLKRIFGEAEVAKQAPANPQEAFDQARALAAQTNSRQAVLVRPDLSLLALACPVADSLPGNIVQQMESIVPSSVTRNIAVITATDFAPRCSRAEVGSPGWTAVGQAIPFFGILNGLACIGHSVWLFDRTSDIAAACRDSDILIIDSDVADGVPVALLDAARSVMRGATILVHDRVSFELRPIALPAQHSVGWAAVFQTARRCTRQGDYFKIVLVQPDQSLLCLPCIPRKAMTSDQLNEVHRLIPEGTARNVAVIAPTRLVCDPSDSPEIAQLLAAGRTIPFFGLLLRLASAGNPLWIFDGREEAVAFGCCQADLLFIDSTLADKLTTHTLDEAARVMRSDNIAVYDRGSRRIALLRHAGKSKDKLEFRD